MKKGCLKIFILILIIIGIIYYLAEKYGMEYWNNGKYKITELVHKEIDSNFEKIIPNKYSQKLEREIIDYITNLKNKKIENISVKIDEINESLISMVKDSIISKTDYKNLRKILR